MICDAKLRHHHVCDNNPANSPDTDADIDWVERLLKEDWNGRRRLVAVGVDELHSCQALCQGARICG